MTLPPDKANRGSKRRCDSCNVLFYDMLRYPIQCPQCGTAVKAGSAGTGRRLKEGVARLRPVRSQVKKVKQAAADH